MKRIIFVLMMALMMPVVSNAQNDAAKKLTKFEQITSKTGKISKFYGLIHTGFFSMSKLFL